MSPNRLLVHLFLALTLAFSLPAVANNGGGTGGTGGGGGAAGGGGGFSAGLSSRVTKGVVKTLNREFHRCQKLPSVYRFDCYRVVYRLASRQLLGNPAYKPASLVLETVETKVDRIVRKYVDPNTPPKRAGFQTYRAIKPAAVPQAKREVEQALAEAETMLLRSAGKNNSHFASIAQAVNSNKVLLRSALLEVFGPVFALLD